MVSLLGSCLMSCECSSIHRTGHLNTRLSSVSPYTTNSILFFWSASSIQSCGRITSRRFASIFHTAPNCINVCLSLKCPWRVSVSDWNQCSRCYQPWRCLSCHSVGVNYWRDRSCGLNRSWAAFPSNIWTDDRRIFSCPQVPSWVLTVSLSHRAYFILKGLLVLFLPMMSLAQVSFCQSKGCSCTHVSRFWKRSSTDFRQFEQYLNITGLDVGTSFENFDVCQSKESCIDGNRWE